MLTFVLDPHPIQVSPTYLADYMQLHPDNTRGGYSKWVWDGEKERERKGKEGGGGSDIERKGGRERGGRKEGDEKRVRVSEREVGRSIEEYWEGVKRYVRLTPMLSQNTFIPI